MLTKVKRREIIRDTPRINPETDWQCNPTPEYITNQMCSLVGKDDYHYLVFFDLMFVETLFEDFDVKPKHITLVTDRAFEGEIAKIMYGKINYVVFPKENLYNNIIVEKNKPTYFSREFIKELNMPKTDKLVIFGNPPYQENKSNEGDVNSKQAVPIYNKFIDACISIHPRYLSMIVPSKWMAGGGRGLNEWLIKMKADKHLKSIKHYAGLNDVFKDVDIAGGVNYFLWDSNYSSDCSFNGVIRDLNKYDIIITDNNAISIVDKLDLTKNMGQVVLSSKPFGIRSNFNNWKDIGIKCYGMLRKIKYTEEYKDDFNILNKWKVCIAKATYSRIALDSKGMKSVIPSYFIIEPGAICTETYLVVNYFDTKKEANNFASYMITKTFKFLLSLRLPTHNTSKDSFSFVPDLQDYTHPWDDKQVCEKIGITDEEFKYIDSKIRDWKETDIEEKETEEE